MSYEVKGVATDGAPVQSSAETARDAVRRADQLAAEGCEAIVVYSLATGELWGADHFAEMALRPDLVLRNVVAAEKQSADDCRPADHGAKL